MAICAHRNKVKSGGKEKQKFGAKYDFCYRFMIELDGFFFFALW